LGGKTYNIELLNLVDAVVSDMFGKSASSITGYLVDSDSSFLAPISVVQRSCSFHANLHSAAPLAAQIVMKTSEIAVE
jgi:hypothetical protein